METQDGALVPRFRLNGITLAGRDETPRASQKMVCVADLRPYQEIPVANAVSRVLQHKGLILEAKCGTGKTVMSLAIAARITDDVVVLVDQLDIAEQWADRIREFVPAATCEIMGGGHSKVTPKRSTNFRIIVAQSLWRREWHESPIRTSLLIVDEVHVFGAPKFSGSLANINFRYSLGLTATPKRKDGLEWVFRASLGNVTEVVAGKVMTASVYAVHANGMAPGVDPKDYDQAWCDRIRGLTHKAACRKCVHASQYPHCGVTLDRSTGEPRWNAKKVAFPGLVQAACSTAEFMGVAHHYVKECADAGRNIMVFSQFKGVLQQAFELGQRDLGADKCGWFVGKAGKKKDPKRATALEAQVTYATYGVAAKALDVPRKDTAILLTPRSDVEQIKGRIERELAGKNVPLVIDLVHQDIHMFRRMGQKRNQQYRESGNPVRIVRI